MNEPRKYNEEILRSLNHPSEPPESVKQNIFVYINAPLPKPNRPNVRHRSPQEGNKSYVSETERQDLARKRMELRTPKKSPRPVKVSTPEKQIQESSIPVNIVVELDQNKPKEDTLTSLLQDAQEQMAQLSIKEHDSTLANRPQARSKLSRTNDQTATPNGKGWKYSDERESDHHRISQRLKQIEYGKNTNGYKNYVLLKPKENRVKGDPQTPLAEQKCSKRSWDGQLRIWRKLLHKYDPEGEDAELSPEESESKQNPTTPSQPISKPTQLKPQPQQSATSLVSREEREELAKMRLSMNTTKSTAVSSSDPS